VVVEVITGEGRGTPMTFVQSTISCVVVGAKKVRTVVVVGQANAKVVVPGHESVTVVAGVWKE
jgi:hypothetical protein